MAECLDVVGEEGEDLAPVKASSREEAEFDETIGHIQDILLDEEFASLQSSFLEKHWQQFDDQEENKFIYTDIHQEYTQLVETHLDSELKHRMPGFEMMAFLKSLESRRAEVCEEIVDMLHSFSDFLAFKQMFLDYKAEKEGVSVDLSGQLLISSLSR